MAQLTLIPDGVKRFDGDPIGRNVAPSLCERLAAFFKTRPGQWIDGRDLATVAGAYGWRTRVSDLRRPPYSLTIENRQRKEGRYTISEYRLRPDDSKPEAA